MHIVHNVYIVCNVCIMCIVWVICANCATCIIRENAVFKIRIILIFRKILFSGFVRKCHFFTSWFYCFSEKTFQCSNDWKCILSYIKQFPLFTKWKRLHFNHQGRSWFSHNFSHNSPVITLCWDPYRIAVNSIFMPKNQ